MFTLLRNNNFISLYIGNFFILDKQPNMCLMREFGLFSERSHVLV